MKTSSLWIIRVALAVQFLSVLAVPTLLLAAEPVRGMWMAEWLRPDAEERAIGVLRLRDGKLTFSEQLGKAEWEVDLAKIKRVALSPDGHALMVVTTAGDEYVTAIMDPSLLRQSPKKALSAIERALQLQSVGSR
jgi:hypothetical protein